MTEQHQQQVLSFIRNLANVPEHEVAAFCAAAKGRRYAKGEDFVRAGERCTEMLFIHRGAFRYYLLTEGKDHTKDFSPAGGFCTAFTSGVTRAPSEIYIGALEDAKVSVWPASAFLERAEVSLAWQRLFGRLAQGLYIRKEQREISLLTDDAAARYLRFRRLFPSLAGFADVEARVPQHYIASYLGLTPETLSRVRRRLREDG